MKARVDEGTMDAPSLLTPRWPLPPQNVTVIGVVSILGGRDYLDPLILTHYVKRRRRLPSGIEAKGPMC